MADTLKNLKIKTSSCKRIAKELASYQKEVEREYSKTTEMKANNADQYDLKQQENVLAESRMMIPDSYKRLEHALSELRGALDELDEDLTKEGPEVKDAQQVITEVEQMLLKNECKQDDPEVDEANKSKVEKLLQSEKV
ncbi:unnamed protein product [Cuscuta epithymum]|uniref:Tubulin-specific chaperone A n=1 Tax=Cuscuta epithymum TaxID=186058 RepID=A0AAV0DH76_9ASTE|nr:unnamed protein product [Cuscuta epithymum]